MDKKIKKKVWSRPFITILLVTNTQKGTGASRDLDLPAGSGS
jgi:hypothetical protein